MTQCGDEAHQWRTDDVTVNRNDSLLVSVVFVLVLHSHITVCLCFCQIRIKC